MSDTSTEVAANRVECPPAKDPAVRLFILAAMLIGLGLYCGYDAFFTNQYPYAKPGEDVNKFLKWAFNNVGAVVFMPLGVVPLVLAIVFLRRRLMADEEGIGYAGRQKISWDKIERLDADKLKGKGILDLYYDGGKKQLAARGKYRPPAGDQADSA